MNYQEILDALGNPEPPPSAEALIDAGVVIKGRNFKSDSRATRQMHLVQNNPYVLTGPLTARSENGFLRLFVAGIKGPQPFGWHPAEPKLIAWINAAGLIGALLQGSGNQGRPYYNLTVLGGRRQELETLLHSVTRAATAATTPQRKPSTSKERSARDRARTAAKRQTS